MFRLFLQALSGNTLHKTQVCTRRNDIIIIIIIIIIIVSLFFFLLLKTKFEHLSSNKEMLLRY
jgi:hypothetical protein